MTDDKSTEQISHANRIEVGWLLSQGNGYGLPLKIDGIRAAEPGEKNQHEN
jgi:hypothetical protein